jgi:hypothetical protein
MLSNDLGGHFWIQFRSKVSQNLLLGKNLGLSDKLVDFLVFFSFLFMNVSHSNNKRTATCINNNRTFFLLLMLF